MDTAGDTQLLRDEFHELENQMGILQKEMVEKDQELSDEKRNSEIVSHVTLTCRSLYPMKVLFTVSFILNCKEL